MQGALLDAAVVEQFDEVVQLLLGLGQRWPVGDDVVEQTVDAAPRIFGTLISTR